MSKLYTFMHRFTSRKRYLSACEAIASRWERAPGWFQASVAGKPTDEGWYLEQASALSGGCTE